MHRTSWILGAYLLMVAIVTGAQAQTTGTIRGQIRDPEGNPLPSVTVEAVSKSWGTTRSTITGESGSFSFPALTVDDYELTASLEGFQNLIVENVRAGLSSVVTLELTLAMAQVEDTITVSSSPVTDFSSSSVGTNYTSEFVENLPTHRNFWDMMAVSPGVSAQSEDSTRMSVFGSSITSNSWSIDGQDATNSETGNAWWYINPETVEEIQVLAIGAPAEFGNMSGAVFNVVTKSGTNALRGAASFYYQGPDLTGENAEINGIPFSRDKYHDLSLSLGGPIKRDRVWFFAAYQNYRDSFSEPGVDPNYPTSYPADRYDIKVNAAINERNTLEAKYHYEDYDWDFGDAFSTPDATGNEFGTNPAWGISWDSVLGTNTLLEVGYAGYSGRDDYLSRTRSTADPFIDYSPPDGGPPRYSGSLWYPYFYDLSRDQANVTVSTHADELLKGNHDFRFGVAYGTGDGDTATAGGINGRYYYRYEYIYDYYGYEYVYPYYYRVTARAYHYGAEIENISAFVDDSWQITPDLTLNIGVRFDRVNGSIPDYPELDLNFNETGEIIPGIEDLVTWSLWSPRLGFAWKTGERGVLRGFYGKFYDANVTGNWDAPPPDAPSYLYEFSASLDGPWEEFFLFEQLGSIVDPNLKAPETDQYTLGYEYQLGATYAIGIQGIYKESKNLIGWEILDDGVYEMVPWTNPFTGEVVDLASIIEQPSTRKGNGPGAGSLAPPGSRYEQEYKGLLLAFHKRYVDGWGLNATYTYSDAEGLIPRPLSQEQGAPFYISSEGRDPNNWINARQSLQNERKHMFQLQGNFDLPWKLTGTVIYRYLSGKPYNRQVNVGASTSASPLEQGIQEVIAISASSDVHLPNQNLLDLAIGREFDLGRTRIKFDVQLFNAFNDDSHDWWETLVVPPGDRFVPEGYIFPRRLMLRLGLRI